MRALIFALACTIPLAGCGSDPTVLNPNQQRRMLATFEPYCMEDAGSSWRNCNYSTYLMYSRPNGQHIVGRVRFLDRDSGAIYVQWSPNMNGGEWFYPGSPLSLPGEISHVVDGARDNLDVWVQLNQIFSEQTGMITMKR